MYLGPCWLLQFKQILSQCLFQHWMYFSSIHLLFNEQCSQWNQLWSTVNCYDKCKYPKVKLSSFKCQIHLQFSLISSHELLKYILCPGWAPSSTNRTQVSGQITQTDVCFETLCIFVIKLDAYFRRAKGQRRRAWPTACQGGAAPGTFGQVCNTVKVDQSYSV